MNLAIRIQLLFNSIRLDKNRLQGEKYVARQGNMVKRINVNKPRRHINYVGNLMPPKH